MKRMEKSYAALVAQRKGPGAWAVRVAAGMAALFLSLLCSLFYNFHAYEGQRILREEGPWQGRITAALTAEDLHTIRHFANVAQAEVTALDEASGTRTVELTFERPRTIYRDLPQLVETLGLPPEAAEYHETLLTHAFIYDPRDETPPLLQLFFLAVLVGESLSLVLIIHNAFAVSMNARVHQLGILASVGGTPAQLRRCLLREAATLCAVPVTVGSGAGVLLCWGAVQGANALAGDLPGRVDARFCYHPLVLVLTLAAAGVTVLVSAWIPAQRLSRLTPLQAIRQGSEAEPRQPRRVWLLSRLFGVEGELAGQALRAQKKALRTAGLSLTLSFLSFTLVLCFLTLSDISTGHTYFARYQDVWDVMATVQDTDIGTFTSRTELTDLPGVESCVIYQKARALCLLPQEDSSQSVKDLGGLEALTGAPAAEGVYTLQAPLVILDDEAFAQYCRSLGLELGPGVVVLDRVWDSVHSNFRYKSYLPLTAGVTTLTLQPAGGGAAVKVPVLGCADQPPALREEYENYALVQVVSAGYWQQLRPSLGAAEPELFIRLLGPEGADLETLRRMEDALTARLEDAYTLETENRLQEKADNDRMLAGYKLLVGGLCGLLAVIGLASVFSNTFGFLYQRRREVARCLSIGMTPGQLGRMFAIEAMTLALRPALITLPLAAVIVGWMIRASYLDPAEFLARAPWGPVLAFLGAVCALVALAYALGARRLLHSDLTEILKNDTQM